MASSDSITLYDLPSKEPCKCWSLNPWKTRLLLNYKGLPYTTEFTEYPDVAPKFKGFGIPPNDPSVVRFQYSSPAIRLPDGTYMMESRKIANHIEKLYPTPSVHLDSPYLTRLEALILQAAPALAPIYMAAVPRELLNPRSKAYFEEERSQKFGMSVYDLEKSPDKGGDAAWAAGRPYLEEIAQMLRENSDGPFFMGKEVSYADFILAGFLRFFDRFGRLDEVLEVDRQAFGGMYEACQPWLERDDH